MRKSRFNLGPKTAEAPIPAPKKQIPKYKPASPKRIQNSSPKTEDLIARELELDSDDSQNDQFDGQGSTRGLPRAQLELEYNAVLHERDVLLQRLADCLENMMKS